MQTTSINSDRLNRRIQEMSQIGGLSSGGVKRLTLTQEDKIARDLLLSWMKALDMDVQIDQIGNMFGILKGKHPNRFIGTGSHLDSVPTGGRYDGPLGVLAALEVAEVIVENNINLNHSLVVANYTNEEGVRFFPDMMGSLAHVNPDQVQLYLQSKDAEGKTVGGELKNIGYGGDFPCGSIPYNYFIELHIEQGPLLEESKKDIGIVKGVQAIHWIKLTIEGKSGHAGTTPLHLRKDTFYALSRLSDFARKLCNEIPNQLITIGSVELSPNAINVIPEKVVATLDVRNPQDDLLSQALEQLQNFIHSDHSFNNLEVSKEILVNVPAVQFSEVVVNAIDASCKKLNLSNHKMHSGAGHDAQILGTKFPAAMIFIPSKDGISHAIDEYSSPEQIERGANTLLHTILALDNRV